TGDEPAAWEWDVSGEYSKRITPDLGVSIGETWTKLKAPGSPAAAGFQDLETTLKYHLFTSAPHEAMISAGLVVDWGATGASKVGADPVTEFTPTLYFGKGAGDLPAALGLLRPLALTGVVGLSIPEQEREAAPGPPGAPIPRVLAWGVALEYSLPYLSSQVKDYGLPGWAEDLTPLIEATFQTPLSRGGDVRTIGTFDPGVIWSGQKIQVGAEALLPMNRRSGKGVGFIIQLHFFLDDMFPHGIGRPLLGGQER
ncbi:MAG: hypothetical protein ACREEH_11990, partial [Caulobacteraceae bacterium]